MTVYYIDHIDGNDSNSGLDFANRKKSLKGALSAGGSNNEYRIMKTPGGLVTPNSTWTSRINRQPNYLSSVVNLGGGLGYQVTHNNHGYQTGDLVFFYAFSESRINGYWRITVVDANTYIIPNPSNNYSGTSGNRFVWPAENQLVTFDVPPVKNILLNVTGNETGNHHLSRLVPSPNAAVSDYTPSGLSHNVPTSAISSYISVYSGFTTGKVCYYPYSSAMDLTGFRQISFFMKQSSGNTLTSQLKWCLCSDATGDVPVYEFTVPATGTTNQWTPMTIDCDNLPEGQTMTTTINSIALYVHTDVNYSYFYFQNFVACRGPKDADCVSHTSVLSPKREGDIWYPVLYMDENVGAIIGAQNWGVSLSSGGNTSTRNFGYVAPSFNPTWNDRYSTVLREENLNCYVMNPPNTHLSAYPGRMPNGSSDTNGEYLYNRDSITVSGGWNSTDMSTRDDPDDISSISWFYSGGTYSSPIYMRNCDDARLENIGLRQGSYGIYCYSYNYNCEFENIHLAGCNTGMYITSTSYGHRVNNVKSACFYRDMQVGGTGGSVNASNFTSVGGDGVIRVLDGTDVNIINVNSKNHKEAPLYFYRCSRVNVKNLTSQNDRWTFYGSSNAYKINTQNTTASGNERFQYVAASSSYAMNWSFWRHSGITVTGFPNDNYVIRPSIAGGGSSSYAVASWTPLYAANGATGYHNPHNNYGWSDGNYICINGTTAIEKRSPNQGGSSMGIISHSNTYRYPFGSLLQPVAVSNQDLGIYSRGLGGRVVVAEFSVIANQTVTFTAQLRRSSYDNNHIQGNLYIGPECGNPITRSNMMVLWNEWEEKSIDVTPTRAGVMRVCVEVYQYYGNTTSQPYRSIDIDTISVSQG